MDEQLKTKEFKERWDELYLEYQTWQPQYKEVSEFMFPLRGRFLDEESTPNDGKRRTSSVIDSTAMYALDVLAAGMQSGLTPKSRQWFKLTLDNKDLSRFDPVKQWLEDVEIRMYSVLSKSNFYQASHNVYYELGGFGTGPVFVEDDIDRVLRCYPLTCGEYVVSVNELLQVDTLYRKAWWKARNIVAKFGEENVSDAVKNANNKNSDTYFKVVHAVEPNPDAKIGSLESKHMAYRSVYYEEGASDQQSVLRHRGYEDFPVMCPRWLTIGTESYGLSPGMVALGDTKMLQTMQQDGLDALAKMVNPPMNAPSTMKNQSLVPGGINYVNEKAGNQTFAPTLSLQPDFRSLEFKNDKTQDMIRKAFFTDVFLMIANVNKSGMTATEIAERHEEKMLMLGPVIERIEPEYLDPVIERTFNLMQRSELIPPPPPELQDVEVRVEYVSILAQAQKAIGTKPIEETVAFTGQVAQYNQDALDIINVDESIYAYADLKGATPKMIRSRDEVKEIRAGRASAAAEQKRAAEAAQMVDSAKTLSETSTGGDTALSQVADTLGYGNA